MKLINGECIEEMKKIEDNSIDMILCDLPYGTTNNQWDIIIPFEDLWNQYNRIIKENGCIALFASSPFDKLLGVSNIKNLKYEWIWHKNKATGHLNSRKMPMKSHENILIFYKKQPTYNYQKTNGHKPMNGVNPKKIDKEKFETRNYNHANLIGNNSKTTERFPRTVLEFQVENNDSKEKFHPTQKPVLLCEYLIKTYTNENETVLDNCMGSGTTGVACKNTNRKFIGIEKDKIYFNKAVERINKS